MSRPILSPFPVITDGDMSGDITSAVTIVQNTSRITYDISWAGTAPVGTMSVQVSDTYTQNADGSTRNAGNWTTLILSEVPSVSGNTGNGFIDIQTGAYAIRLVYNFTSGTGLMQATISGKVS